MSDAHKRIAEQMKERGAEDPDLVQDIPAGGGGADSGPAEAVRVEPDSWDDNAEGVDTEQSVHNDEPGVGPRGAD
ncbi:hypothetical protein [uncultured Microbacterium sp.]|uniref:hypothetical protein n=1 Tax=uncultured Microbacterium sp. TaxID=191216 RepID=UPI0028D8D2D7|nr:hypothetical protein [uncultured Microbacterium sp.]